MVWELYMWKNFCSSIGGMFDFSGREKRNVFWSTAAVSLIILAAIGAVIGITVWMQSLFHTKFIIGGNPLVMYETSFLVLTALLLYFPIVSCAVRRLHDAHLSGMLLIIPLVNLLLLCLQSSNKSYTEKRGFRYGLGQLMILLVFIALAGFSTVSILGKMNASTVPAAEVAEKTETRQEKKKAEENPYLEKDDGKEVSQVEEPRDSQNEKKEPQKNQDLLNTGAVIIPIIDERELNYIRTGSETLPDGKVATQYKHIQTLKIDFLTNTNIYDGFDSPTVIGNVNLGEDYTILSITHLTNPQENDTVGQFWLEVAYGKGSGYISAGTIDNPYRNDNYVPLEKVQIGEKVWTIRKFDSLFSFNHSIDIRNNPGTQGTSVIGKIDASTSNLRTVTSDAITEQDDTSKGPTAGEPWIRIEYEGISGWIPGAYAVIDHGGVKYQTPDGILKNDLGVGI